MTPKAGRLPTNSVGAHKTGARLQAASMGLSPTSAVRTSDLALWIDRNAEEYVVKYIEEGTPDSTVCA